MTTDTEAVQSRLARDNRRVRWVRISVAAAIVLAITYGWQLYEARQLAQSNRASLNSTHTLVVELKGALASKAGKRAEHQLFLALRTIQGYEVSICQHLSGCHKLGLR